MTLGLAMIVKNEAEVVGRCIDSVRDIIDFWVVQDTGSTDDTCAVIERALDGIPGELHHEPWVNFAHNRSVLLEKARGKCDWLLCLDADMTLDSHGPYPDADAGGVRFSGPLDWQLPFLINGHHPFRYEGPAHEYLTSDTPFTLTQAPGWMVTHHGDGGNQTGKLDRYLELLGGDPRSTFYRAQTLRDLGERDAAVAEYRRRVALGGWDQERFYAQLQVGLLLDDPAELLAAWELRPGRAEPLYALASYYRDKGQWNLAYLFASRAVQVPYPDEDIIFVDRGIYEWGCLLERSIAAWWVGDRETAYLDSLALLAFEGLPAHVREPVETNLALP